MPATAAAVAAEVTIGNIRVATGTAAAADTGGPETVRVETARAGIGKADTRAAIAGTTPVSSAMTTGASTAPAAPVQGPPTPRAISATTVRDARNATRVPTRPAPAVPGWK